MKKISISLVAMLMLVAPISAQESSDKVPEAGSIAIGVVFNPVTAAKATTMAISSVGNAVGNTIMNLEGNPKQMFFLAQEPMVSIQMKYKVTSSMAVRASVGFSGGMLNYREYVTDDKAVFLDPYAEDKVADAIKMNYTGGGVSLGVEWNAGKKSLRFVGGVGLLYSFGGGDVNLEYGNTITDLNQHPTCMDKITALNDFDGNAYMPYARPVKQYNVGITHGVGITANMGVEWFFMKNVSLGATVNITPIMVAFQPQTYTIYEGFNTYSGKVEKYNKLVSPGSTYLLYGTDNIGVSLALHYYF
ncbi:MAG: hypothetical protein EOM76_06720 [Sphingobacteriia bacterium]|nr:hypothetical protein [Sphingobacteriia bacterium]